MSHYRRIFLGLLLLWPLPGRAAEANLILKNGRVWTADPANPWAEALAIRGNRVLAAGGNQEVAALAGPNAQVIDLGGRLTIPGFNDSHVHFLSGSLRLGELDLDGACSAAEIQKRTQQFAAAHSKDPWIVGFDWDRSCLSGKPPSREDLDAAVKDRPVFLTSTDERTACVNTKALQLAGITNRTKVIGLGQIAIDPKTGEPAGCLTDGAIGPVRRIIPDGGRERKIAALEQGLKLAASLGVTSFEDGGGDAETVSLFDDLARQHKLTARVGIAMAVTPQTSPEAMDHFLDLKEEYHNSLLHVGSVDFVLDGTVESHSAALLEPYSDLPGNAGRLAWSSDAFGALVSLCDSVGLQVITEAHGDRAVRVAIDAYENARKANGIHDSRFRIERAELIAPSDLPRLARLGVITPVRPIPLDAGALDRWNKVVGPQRLNYSFPWRSLRQAGVRLAFSSDWPVMTLDPIRGIYNAVTRETTDGKPAGGWTPEQRINVDTAVRAYTINGAYASFEERQKGELKAGRLADIAVLSQNLFTADPANLWKAKVDITIFDGKVIFHRQ